jgi:hypothetical protein
MLTRVLWRTQVVKIGQTKWGTLRQLLDARDQERSLKGLVKLEGVAAQHPQRARDAAAKKLILNHVAILNDVTNPRPLTQKHLQRVQRVHALYADQGLREVRASRALAPPQPALKLSTVL